MARSAVILAGDWEIPWSTFAVAVKYLYSIYYRFSNSYKSNIYLTSYTIDRSWQSLPLESVEYMCQINMAASHRPLLLGLLALERNRGATQPVDYVFAVLNLSADWMSVENGTTQDPWIEPNYTIPVSVIFTQATMWLICFHGSLDSLSFAEFNDADEPTDIPSWVHVWSCPKRSTDLAHGDFNFTPDYSAIYRPYRRLLCETGYNADLGEPMPNKPFENQRFSEILEVTGLKLSSIAGTSDALFPKGTGVFTAHKDPTPEEVSYSRRGI